MKRILICVGICILLFSGLSAKARVFRINECIISLGGFCIIETLILIILGGLFIFFVGTPLRFFLKKYMNMQYKKNKNYKPSNFILSLYSQSSIVSMFVLSCIVLAIFFVLK